MCGILALAGKVKGISEAEVQMALNSIHHRGPDDYGMESFDDAVLGFRRLSIIDLSHNGHQPMSDAAGRYWIIFNGEIYNHKEIRERLEKEGVVFKSASDTEVILYGYINYGSLVVDRLDGMFAFVIYDKLSGNVFAARDRMGKKPLLYYQDNDVVLFFSELKQITSFSFFDKQVSRKAISLFLTYGAIPSPYTIFENVHQVEPGQYATLTDGSLTMTTYWTPQIQTNGSPTYEELRERTHDLVTKSIRKRLISDVPLGAFLSGGIDSSIITAVMANYSSDVKTFSINYAGAPQNYDETYYANLVVRRYGTKHSTITIAADDVYNDIENIIWHMDQPSGDAINTYFVSQSARRGVTVSLSGVGGDEIFAGYSTFKFAKALGKVRPVRKVANGKSSLAGKVFFKLPNDLQVNWKVRMLAGALGAFPTGLSRYNLIKEIYRNDEVQRIFYRQSLNGKRTDFLEDVFNTSMTNIQQITLAEVNHYLKSTLLRDADVMGMAKSLEIRCPFIDHELIEFALTIPDEYKIRNLETKFILKDAFKDYLPDEVIHRKKMGFAFPLSVWLKTGKLKELVEDCLSEETVSKRQLFTYSEVKRVKDAYFSLKKDSVQTYQFYQKVWLLVVLEMWMRKYVD